MFHKFAKRIITVFLFLQATFIAAETKVIDFTEHGSPQMQTFVVESQDLYFDQDNIFVFANELFYNVHSLKKSGDQWLVEAASGYRCPWGHPSCEYCNMCHIRICPLYQSRCSRSK